MTKKIVIGDNELINEALRRRLKGEEEVFILDGPMGSLNSPQLVNDSLVSYPLVYQLLGQYVQQYKPEIPTEVYFTGGYPFGSQAVRERPADVCSRLAHVCLNVINVCHHLKVSKMVFLASSCIYPPSQDPLREDSVTGVVMPLNEPAALPRLLALKQCQFYRKQYGQNFVVAVPATAYGPGDDFSHSGHALPMMMKKLHDLKMQGASAVTFQGSGAVYREWIYSVDLADALVRVMEHYDSPEPINIGGKECSMNELVSTLQAVVGTIIPVRFDNSVSPGVRRQYLDSRKIRDLGWWPARSLRAGLEATYEWYKTSRAAGEPQRQD